MAVDNVQEHKKETASKEPIDLTVNEVKSPPENRKLMNAPKKTNCVKNLNCRNLEDPARVVDGGRVADLGLHRNVAAPLHEEDVGRQAADGQRYLVLREYTLHLRLRKNLNASIVWDRSTAR